MKHLLFLVVSSLWFGGAASALTNDTTPYGFTTLAGSAGNLGSSDGTGTAARFNYAGGLAVDASGNLYVADTANRTIRKVTPAGVVTTLAGLAGTVGSSDGTGSAARFFDPTGIVVDPSGNLFVTDSSNNTIRKITPGGVVTTFAGMVSAGNQGSNDGIGTAARFYYPRGLALDASGNLYVADSSHNTIRKITSAGVVTTLAGTASASGAANDGTGATAGFSYPFGVAVDVSGNVYVADQGNSAIRKITPAGVVTTLAGLLGTQGVNDSVGSAARFNQPEGIAVDSSGNLFVTDLTNPTIRMVTPQGLVSTVAGSGAYGSSDGIGSAAEFNGPAGIAVDASGKVDVSDTYNFTIRVGTAAVVPPAGTASVVYTFGADSDQPVLNLVQGKNGLLYGITNGGTPHIFSLTTNGVLTNLATLPAGSVGGSEGAPGMVQGTDGNFYGVLASEIFKMTPTGGFTVLHTYTDLEAPNGLTQGTDGNFYGTTEFGGTGSTSPGAGGSGASGGTAFKITSAGVYTVLHSFDYGTAAPYGATSPTCKLVQGTDGYFYGTTSTGGACNEGTVFKMSTTGGVTILHSFSLPNGTKVQDVNGNLVTDGAYPLAGLIQGTDGNFYGKTSLGGPFGNDDSLGGTIFRITPAGVVTILHAFDDSTYPLYDLYDFANLVQATDGNFYGTTPDGFFYEVTPTGIYNALFNIYGSSQTDASDTSPHTDGVIQAADGNFYVIDEYGTNFYGNVLKFSLGLAVQGVPIITSATTATATAGQPFSYQIAASNNPTSFSITTSDTVVVQGLTYNTSTGLFSGTPTLAGTFHFTLSAINGSGPGTSNLTLTVLPAVTAPPVITSASTANATAGVAFSYQIIATNSPTSYAARGLPAGLSLNTTTGLITGTPTVAGTDIVSLTAKNAGGTSSVFSLTLAISGGVPVITNVTSVSGGYQIVASNNPTSYAATGLPAGMTLNTTTGLISGFPTVIGTYVVTLTAKNASGTSSAVSITITATAAAPVITSATTAAGVVGTSFSYQIVASNSPTGYTATGLPTGLTLNATTGVISGAPTVLGTFTVILSAKNSTGTSNVVTLTITITGAPVISSATTAAAGVGAPFSYQIVAKNNPTSYGAAGLPTGLALNSATGLITGNPTVVGTYQIALSAVNGSGTGTATLTLTVALTSQTISFPTISNRGFSSAPFALGAMASSGLPITYTSSGPVKISNGMATLTGLGTVAIRASQPGNTAYAAATSVLHSFTVSQGTQTISFPAIGSQVYPTAAFTTGATASSGLAVYYTTSGPVKISGNTVTITGAGTVSIRAHQDGNTDYAAATTVLRSFTVSKAP